MHAGRVVFSQLMDFFPMYEFQKLVRHYRGNYKVRTFSCLDQFLCMAFAQLTGRESLRDLEICLRAMHVKLYHAGIRGKISRSTLADANEHRNWRIYADLAQILIREARRLYVGEDFGVVLKEPAYVFDSTAISLCLALFPWAHFRKRKGAIKLHTQIDLRGNIPCFMRITPGMLHDVTVLDDLILEPGSFYLIDRAYIDFARLYVFTLQLAFFVTRAKSNLHFRRCISRPVDRSPGLRSDQTIILTGPRTSRKYPVPLRRIRYFDAETDIKLVFLTNNFTLPALIIPQLYKCRWKVETFFKWIKQYLHIKAFFGTSENAVHTQIWIAISVYVLVSIIRKTLTINRSLGEIMQVLSLSLLEDLPLSQLVTTNLPQDLNAQCHNQLQLFTL